MTQILGDTIETAPQRKADPSIMELHFEICSKDMRVKEVESQLLYVKREEGHHLSALKYLTSSALPSDLGRKEEVEEKLSDVQSIIEQMISDWKRYTKNSDPNLDLPVFLRTRFTENRTVPADLQEKLLPHLIEQFPTILTVSSEPSTQVWDYTPTQPDLDAITEPSILSASKNRTKPSFNFLQNPTISQTFQTLHPTNDTKYQSLRKVWDLLPKEWQTEWYKRDVIQIEKQKTYHQESDSIPRPTLPHFIPSTTILTTSSSPKFSSFHITSPKVLWGQLPQLLTLPSTITDSPSRLPASLEGGTILQHAYTNTCAAKVGKWNLTPFKGNNGEFSNWSDNEEHFGNIGWVFWAEGRDPVEIVRRCALTQADRGISNGNRHYDKGVMYINRYDWSYHWSGKRDTANQTFLRDLVISEFGSEHVDSVLEVIDELSSGGCFLVDADVVHNNPGAFLKRVLSECRRPDDQSLYRPSSVQMLLGTPEREHPFGAFVAMERTEYELGWLVFDQIPPTAKGEDVGWQLVAMVYDGAYDGLGGDRFVVEGI
ncbi:hypothetical protein HK097_000440 [Rhizophlyctis rosea]|uniref:Uncharacterized protein n=1 Tax=Rhizophlyctis rosea TaxID=64517 RepID=A0AAD5S8H5_9FUNG|nr:hypothetical protein HK097_000440 [Rhizophlyctis rosea]